MIFCGVGCKEGKNDIASFRRGVE